MIPRIDLSNVCGHRAAPTQYIIGIRAARGGVEIVKVVQGRQRISGSVGVAEWSFEDPRDDGRTVLIRGCDIFEFVGDKIRKKDAFRKVFGRVGESM